MPAKGFITPGQQENLQKALRESDDKHLRERILMLLLMNDGKTYQQISDFLGCSYRSVAYWCVHGDPDNLESLKDKREQGNHRKVTDAYLELLLEVVKKKPSEFGYEFGRWTGEGLATYMAKQTGIKLTGKQVRRILEQRKDADLWAKSTLENKQDPKKREAFKENFME
ncbi:MAG: IS630 family transposase [Brasilonema sp.]